MLDLVLLLKVSTLAVGFLSFFLFCLSLSHACLSFPLLSVAPVVTLPCSPSPCGPNSQCREINGQAVCSCVPGFSGSPPACRPAWVVSSECGQNEACSNQKCRNPCPGICGFGARCHVGNHNPICSCPARFTGDPFVRCQPIRKKLTLLCYSALSWREL